ncbi:unnamed protein product [Neospora caninum Liverpool]|uniref:Toxoplasma gondii family A protein n=1 Tax=Neospora caninum (strain Liverpool) TaxID=572307 RepID=F0VRL7_NEOCL|nr:uncharacterized protein NCLIV_067890 [Neospora caninum Liverpool]CBZ56365.1 unnamed protein product [Neospora caninum Liverpool]CEL71125.1 TPA: hypothetical protein BN1204_067890 [Neospora caninum Liverpool]|eukprot:XP_003886390.1 uncharacterized protein NCLIV_067890 [Neospora caninum Liverpool]
MESSPLRAFWLTVLIGGFLPCVLCDTSDLTAVDPDFTVSIPKDGLPRDLEEVFFLQPAGTLRVIDETGSAVYMPQMSTDSEDGAPARIRTDSGDASSETYSAAYAFVNGKCDFTKEIQYKDAFPGYSQPIWVWTASADAAEAKASSGGAVANFTLTNPPEEYLTEVVSFCVRFKTFLAAGSSTTTTTTSTGMPTASNIVSNPTGGPSEHTESSRPNTPQAGGSTGSGGNEASGSPGVHKGEEGQQLEDKGEAQGSAPAVPAPGVPPTTEHQQHGDGASHPKEQDNAVSAPTQNAENNGGSQLTHGDMTGAEEADSGETVEGEMSARARRLSDTPTESYLTIVVHSAAWGLAGGIGAISAFVLCIAAALSSTF